MDTLLDLQFVLRGCLLTLAVGMVFAFIRLLRGPTLPDRVVALDAMSTIAIGFLTLFSMTIRRPLFLDVALAIALIAFLGTVAFARYMEKDKSDPPSK